MAHVHALICGVGQDTQGHQLPGAELDVRDWSRRLRAMGVRAQDMVELGTDTDHSPTRAAVLQAVEDLAGHLARDPGAHALLVISAHGGGDALFHAADGPVRADELTTLLDRIAPGRGLTAVLDICPTDDSTDMPPGLRPVDLVLRAASAGHPAEEHRDGDRWHGAFSWACHQVMDRWMSVGPHGALVPISARVLVDRATLVLRGLGYGQQPVLQGPAARFDAPLLGGDRVLSAPLQAGLTRQVDPGMPDAFKVYDIQDATGSIGLMVVTGNTWTPTGNWAAGVEYWSVLPQGNFSLVPTNAGLPSSVPTLKFDHVHFNPAGSTPQTTLPANSYEIKAGSSVTGYMTPSGTSLTWYKTATVTTHYPLTTLSFAKLTGTPTISAQQRVSNRI